MNSDFQAGWDMAKAVASDDMCADRSEYLDDMVCLAIEHAGYGAWMHIEEYHFPEAGAKHPDYKPAYAVIVEVGDHELSDDELRVAEHLRVDHNLIERALARIRGTDSIPYLGDSQRNLLRYSDFFNDAGTPDVIDGLAVIEIGLFGEVRYA